MVNSGSFWQETSPGFMANFFGEPFNYDTEITQWFLEQEAPTTAVEPTQIDDNSNGKVDSEVAHPLTKPKKQRVSEAWNSFHVVKEGDGTESAKCNHCPKKYKRYSTKKGTSNLLKHKEKCTPNKGSDGDKPAAVGESGGTKTTPVLHGDETLFSQEWSNMSKTMMIMKHAFPLCMVESNLQPTLQLQSYGILKADLLHTYNEEKEKLRRSFGKSSSGRFNLTINFWRRDSIIFYCCLTLHFIDDDWKLKKKTLDFKKVIRLNYGPWEPITTLRNMLKDWSIGKNICSITAQNTSDHEVNEIVGKVKRSLDRIYQDHNSLPSTRKSFQLNCFVHFLNVLVEDGLNEVRDVYLKLRKWIIYFHETAETECNFRHAVQTARSKGKKVTSEDMLPVSLRTFNFQILEEALGLREAFFELQNIDWGYSNDNFITKEEWDKANCICECLKVLDDAARRFSVSTCLTTNVYFPEVCNIYWKFCEWEEVANSHVQSMARKMKLRVKEYWDNSIESLAIAVILDPRFKFDIVERWCKKIYGLHSDAHARIHSTLTEVYNEYAAGSKNTSAPSFINDYHLLDPLGMRCKSDDGESKNSELERYLEESKFRLVEELDILGWWRVNKSNFPTLAKMARDFLAIPVSAAQSNPSFNDEVMKIDQALVNLESDEIKEALISTHYWWLERKDCSNNLEHAPFK